MNSLIKTSIKRSVTVCVLVIVLMAVGVLATLDMSTNLLPNIRLPMLGISVVYPGASARSVEEGVTAKLEQALQTVPGIKELSTTSYDNVAVAVLTFDYGTDIDEKISAIEDSFDSVAFPDGCEEPDFVKIDMNGTATATVALYNSSGDVETLTADAESLAAKLSGIEGVGSVSVLGAQEHEVRITALEGLDISALLIVQALQNENLDIPLGSIMQDGTTVSVRNATDADSVYDIMRLPVRLDLGSALLSRLDGAKSMLTSLEECTLDEFKQNVLSPLFTLRMILPLYASMSDAEVAAALQSNPIIPQSSKSLISASLIHMLRQPDCYMAADSGKPEGPDNISPDCTLGKLLAVKSAHVDDEGAPLYANGTPLTVVDGKRMSGTFYVDPYGYLMDEEGHAVDEEGHRVTLNEQEAAARYARYGAYTVFTDQETASLCDILSLGDNLGVSVTSDLVRLVRLCDFGGSTDGSADGSVVYPDSITVPLTVVGRVEYVTERAAYAEYNGLAAVTVEVYAVADANTTQVVDSVKNVLARSDVKSNVLLLDDKAEFITDSISNVLSSIIIGGVLAVLVIYLFVRRIGSSLVVSITMPLSVLTALAGLWIMNISLNLVSLGGLAVGIGMLVDNSIVVLESITKRRDRGESVYDACLNGTKEVAGSLFASTLTNVCVFFPILFARGLTREIFYDLVWAVLFSIVMSLIVAITVIPSLYHLIYRKGPRKRFRKNADGTYTQLSSYEDNEPRERINNRNDKSTERRRRFKEKADRLRARLHSGATISKMESGYGKILSKVLTKRVLVCVLALVLFGSSVALVFTTGTEFLPSVDKGVIEVDIDFDTAADIEVANAASKQAADVIREHYGNKLEYVSLTVGKQGLLAMSNSGVIRIQTTKQLKTSETVQEIRDLLAEQNIQAKSVTVREMDGVVAEVTGGMSGQSVTLLCDDQATLREAAAKVRDALLKADPEHIVSAVDNTPALNTEYSFTFDRTKCIERGVDYSTAVMLLRVGMSGYTAADLDIEDRSCAVNVIFADSTTSSMDALCELIVGFDEAGPVRLKDVLTPAADGKLYSTDTVAAAIEKENGRYTTSIDLEIYGTDSGSAGKVIKRAVHEALSGYPDVEYEEGGVSSYLNDAFDGLVVSLIAAFVLLYSVMACQFESLSKPFVVIMSIPFSFTGGFLALAITGMTLNVVSFVGLIMLMGVIVNGAIVMIDKINMLIAEGMSPQEAVIEGCKTRLRPILMTTLTTVLALVPLALGLGRGGELMQPMGIVVLGGLLLGTLVTLVLIPCFYCLIKRIRFDKRALPAAGEQEEGAGEENSDEQITDNSDIDSTDTDAAEGAEPKDPSEE